MIVYIIIISIHFSKSKIYAEKLKLLEFSVALLINYSAIVIIFTITKSMIALERPLCQLQPNSFILPYPEIEKVCHHSFPSAHSAFATLVAISLWSKVNFFGKLLLIFLVIAVAISRIGLAMHYPADVIYGIFFVFIINYISQKNAKSFAGFLIKLFPAILGK
ncbi:MAG: phosphatase PAP2 family protein [Rickettsiaceae bacterium]|nr:phosphatase PAP2 family protein [Rickettsiaceae bacterium]